MLVLLDHVLDAIEEFGNAPAADAIEDMGPFFARFNKPSAAQ